MFKFNPFFFIFFFLTIIVSVVAVVQSKTHPSDISALKSLKSSIKPSSIPSYSCLASWIFSSDPCAQPRVTHFTCGLLCSPDSRVTQITLDPAGYSGPLSPQISLLTYLTILDLSDNNFNGPIPSSLSSLHYLSTLILRSNSFSGAVPPTICNLKSLQSMDLSRNSLSGSLPATMNSMAGLRRLDLSFNRISGWIPRLPPALLELAIRANLLSGCVEKAAFEGLSELAVVELGNNLLAGTLGSWFFLLPAIQQVNLANNSLTNIEIWKPQNSDLVAVDLSFNNLKGIVPVNFAAYPLLSSLSLRHNQLRGPIPTEFSKKGSLRRLFLDGNFLNGTPPEGFFSGEMSISCDLGDNCLARCPVSSEICSKSQKPASICRQAYGGKPRS